ncbi:PepSY-associated TM helix domain-containing protein [Vibrio diazotrophicus]|uniref:PepSY-associated TM helix domain-containing protein n=1 Tax=Vibrio diazotrophicus TaxID=685 RepID=UPI0005AB1183|nr:PepSY domain-containing protein [Vibrio diazotrophicus]
MLRNSTPPQPQATSRAKSLYFMTWRWHFYAGLFVIPFILILSLTGLVMLFDDEIEQARYHDLLIVTPQHHELAVSAQVTAVQQRYPDYVVTQFIPSQADDLANKVSVRTPDGINLFAMVDPYSGQVLGTIDRSESWYSLANEIHATLLMGDLGDYLIEVAASLGLLLLVTGLYLWWPRDNASKAGFLKLRMTQGTRLFMRDLHANLGGVLSIVLLFFLISGLSWTGIWGKTLVQAWNAFPTYYTWGEKPQSTLTHASLNHGAEEEMPWNLEQAPMPESTAAHDHSAMNMEMPEMAHGSINVDKIVAKAEQLGFTQYRVYFPNGEKGVYTVAANTMAGDITDPRNDRTSHFDQYTGNLLVDVTWADYTLYAKAMAAGVSLHQGDLSRLNKGLNVFFCLAFIAIALTGIVMWWIRRPSGSAALGVPPRFATSGIWKTGLVTLILLAVLFPLGGITIVITLILDWLLFSRVEKLRLALR